MNNNSMDNVPFHLQKKPRFGFPLLMVSLVALQLIPAFSASSYTDAISIIMITLVLFAALYLVAHSRKELVIGLLMGLPIIVSMWWVSTHDSLLPSTIHFILATLYLSYVCIHIIRYVFETRDVSLDMMYASVCIYFLLGMIWGMIYALLEIFIPGSFRLGPIEPGSASLLAELSYFSYVTLATLGYGDIVPLTSQAKTLSNLQAIVGQFYLAFVVARLVALHIVSSDGKA